MKTNKRKQFIGFTFLFFVILWVVIKAPVFFNQSIDYNTDVKPILNKHCISCHGGVKQSSGFSLLSAETAFMETESGAPAITPGNPHESAFIQRLLSEDPEERMPLDAPPLSNEDIKILKKWVKQGAKWGVHWAYKPLEKEVVAAEMSVFSGSKLISTNSQKIDLYIREALKEKGLQPASEAGKAELLRRVSMDIIGLPAPKPLQEKFLNGKLDYATLVDTLLEMPAYGEKWSSMWLDIARYADSKGFERDPFRSIWHYRDYVINSFNEDKPYNTFIIEQIAGDLLDRPSDEQLIATGFHRNTQTNDEGGTDNEEYRVKAVMDRVNTTWEGIMGTTMACVQCHGHPYDPFPQEDYYRTFAFLNNTRDADTHMDYPRLKFLDTLTNEKLKELTNWVESVDSKEKALEIKNFVRITQPVIYSIEVDEMQNAALYDTKYLGLRKNGSARIQKVNLTGKTTFLTKASVRKKEGFLELRMGTIDGKVIGNIDLSTADNSYGFLEIPLSVSEGFNDIFLVYSNPKMTNEQAQAISFDWFYFYEGFPGSGNDDYDSKKQLFKLLVSQNRESTLIMIENPTDRQRKTHVYDRGNWLTPTDEVNPGVPGILPPLPANEEANRLTFANWMVDENNPLTSRTFVNRVWEQLFGRGIVRTLEDLGSQGDLPSHPELLDYLSSQWMHDQKWSVKALIKAIVNSETYRQSSVNTIQALEDDPLNIYLSHSPRIRLTAEQIRDQALFISGLLSSKMHGPPVMPYQPGDIWQTPYNNESWEISDGEDRYRRAVYTMIKRTSGYPSFETFDMSQRQVCTSRRIRTNSPLQALVTLNDPVYVEASAALAKRMEKEGGKKLESQIDFAYQLSMSKPITVEKSSVLVKLYEETKTSLLESSLDQQEAHELALTIVANAIINLDEMLNK